MNFYSMTQAGQLVQIATFIAIIAKLIDATIDEEQIKQAVLSIGNGVLALIWIVGVGVSWYGRYRKGDLKFLGSRKTPHDKLNDLLK